MVVYTSPDIFQDKMSALMDNLEIVRVYLGNFLIIASGSFEKNFSKVEEVMKRLQFSGLKCNIDN